MELTLKRLLEQAKFTTGRKGYDQSEVDDFLDRAVAMAAKVEATLTEALDQAQGSATAGAATPEEVEAEVERRVQARLEEERAAAPAASPVPSEEEQAEEVRRTLVLAQRTADAAVKEARDEADALLADARDRASALAAAAEADAFAQREALTAEIERERAAARERLGTEIRALEGAREALRSDVTLLESHVEEQRAQLRSTVAELQRLLDDPSGFRLAPAPVITDPVVVLPDTDADAEASTEAAVDTPAVDTPADGTDTPTDTPADGTDTSTDGSEADPDEGVTLVDLREGADGDPEAHEPEPPDPEAAVADDGDPWEGDDAPQPVAEPGPVAESVAAPLTIEEIDHETPGIEEPPDSGPPTAPVGALELDFGFQPASGVAGDEEDDAFLAELRKAMADDEPLGPRDEPAPSTDAAFFDDDDRRGWRFGKRR